MKKEEIYNEAIGGDEGFAPGEGYPSCDGQPCANVSGDDGVATDTMTDATPTGRRGTVGRCRFGRGRRGVGCRSGRLWSSGARIGASVAEWQDKYLAFAGRIRQLSQAYAAREDGVGRTGRGGRNQGDAAVADDMDRAVEAMAGSDDIEALRAGVGLIAQKFHEVLRSCGVSEIEAKGLELDTDHHEAVARFQAGEEQRGKIVDVVQKGYRLRDKVLRFAKVVVGE